jgi:hypothetical protein
MPYRLRTAFACVLLAAGVCSGLSARDAQRSAQSFSPPRTPWGDPDLQGMWPSGPLVEIPFERPASFGTRAELNDEEFAAALRRAETDFSPGTAPPPHWLERGVPSRQASLIVDPPDGRLPPLTPDGAQRAERWRATTAPTYAYAGPEDLTPYDRCISRGVLGSHFPNIYSTGMQILQTPGLVVVLHEMVHEARIIPLDPSTSSRPHVSSSIRSYMGDPRGRWDGSTLVVETRNFNGKTGSYGRNGNGNPTSEALHLVERFSLLDANTLQYEVTVTDPETWVRPWTVRFPIPRDESYQTFEYACHEGNYAMTNSLKAARASEGRPATEP